MTRLAVGRRIQARRARRGGGFLALLLVALPLMLFGLSLSFDYSRALFVNRQAADVAEVMAMAAATGFSITEPGELDPGEAVRRGNDMFNQALAVGMISRSGAVSNPRVTMLNGNRAVRAQTFVRVPLLFPSIVLSLLGQDPTRFSITTDVSRTASVCQEDNAAQTCLYPVTID
jgi:uncharacterized membrane protein